MAENKMKISTNRIQIMGEKSPPTKLLINHGKPNFTIIKSPKTPKTPKDNSTTDGRKFFEATTTKPNFIIKRAEQLKQNGTPPTDNEFKRLHQKISGKHIDNMTNNIEDTKTNGNSENIKQNGITTEVSVSKVNLPKEQHFATLQKNCVISVKTKDAESDNETHLKAIPKPPTPEKPNGHILTPKTPTPKPSHLNNNGVNFEQRSMISFAKDLSVEPNRYPDTVKIVKNIESTGKPLPKEFNELKFEIASNGEVLMPFKKIVH